MGEVYTFVGSTLVLSLGGILPLPGRVGVETGEFLYEFLDGHGMDSK
jgi:hypothetical protein